MDLPYSSKKSLNLHVTKNNYFRLVGGTIRLKELAFLRVVVGATSGERKSESTAARLRLTYKWNECMYNFFQKNHNIAKKRSKKISKFLMQLKKY